MKPEELAAQSFHGPEGDNCAQAVARAFGASSDLLKQLASAGGGRAPEGRCGALHGALMFLSDNEEQKAIQLAFREEAGSEGCREIRGAGEVSCRACVQLAARLLDDRLNIRSCS